MRINNKGFTLIEMIVTIGILSVLAVTAIAVLNPFAQFQKANDSKRKADLSQIQKALESYYEDYGAYPISSAGWQLDPITSAPGAPIVRTEINWGSSWQPYMNVVPADPVPSKHYLYVSPAALNGQAYYIYASLDRGSSDPQACTATVNGVKYVCAQPPQSGIGNMDAACGNGSGSPCNFGVTSPNVSP